MAFSTIKQKLLKVLLYFLDRNQIIRLYRKSLRFIRRFKKLVYFFNKYSIYEIIEFIKIYFLGILSKQHFQNLKKTISLDYDRILSYIHFFDTPLYIQDSKKSVYYFY